MDAARMAKGQGAHDKEGERMVNTRRARVWGGYPLLRRFAHGRKEGAHARKGARMVDMRRAQWTGGMHDREGACTAGRGRAREWRGGECKRKEGAR
jgi:hypothetical protein